MHRYDSEEENGFTFSALADEQRKGRWAVVTFSSPAGKGDRWVWHPRVHQLLFHESCFYFICRVLNPHFTTIHGTLKNLLAEADIRSPCVYPLLGPYDALIRLWATEERRRRFLIEARRAGSVIQSLYEFRTDDDGITYTWWHDMPEVTDDLLYSHRSRIESVARADIAGQLEHDGSYQDQLSELAAIGFARKLGSFAGGHSSIKFYSVLESQTSFEHAENLIKSVHHYFSEDHSELRNVSIYEGTGFGRVLIKAEVDEFPSLIRESEGIGELAVRSGFRPMTLLLVSTVGEESDSIGNIGDELSSSVTRLVQTTVQRLALTEPMRFELQHRFMTMTGVDRESYVQIVEDYPMVFSERPDSLLFFRLLYALVTDDVERFGDSLVFLQKMESLLRRYLRRTWVEIYGESWRNEVISAAVSSGGDIATHFSTKEKQDPKEWTLHDLLTLSGCIADKDSRFVNATETEDHLGRHWRSILLRVVQLRNDVAHGRVYEYRTLEKYWPAVQRKDQSERIRAVLDSARIYLRLSDLSY